HPLWAAKPTATFTGQYRTERPKRGSAHPAPTDQVPDPTATTSVSLADLGDRLSMRIVCATRPHSGLTPLCPVGLCSAREARRRCMGSAQSYPPGTPAWVNLQTAAGPLVASRFYCALFGWTVLARHRPLDDASGWWVFRLGGKDVGDI